MNFAVVDKIAKAVLYEGYMLYPYRPSSVKNQRRWNFGVISPPSYSEAQDGSEASSMQTECLVEGSSYSSLEIRVRFLQLVARSVGEITALSDKVLPNTEPEFHLVENLIVDGHAYQPWEEAIEREVTLPIQRVDASIVTHTFDFPADKQSEPFRDASGQTVGVIIRERKSLSGSVEIAIEELEEELFKIRVQIRNAKPFATTHETSRQEALLSSMVSTHTVLGVQDGRFVSLLAPPERMAGAAGSCKNVGTWPVLVGEAGQCDTMLSSPIILYDYPQIAPESAGDLFDGTEIDEILSLRIMTLTDDEKREMSQSDERARAMLERTETMPVEHWMKLHGVLRGLRPLTEETR
ncbi:MAG: hypothetical protein ACLQLC_10725 [Candidatus Sulfotelmatobacter sp.]